MPIVGKSFTTENVSKLKDLEARLLKRFKVLFPDYSLEIFIEPYDKAGIKVSVMCVVKKGVRNVASVNARSFQAAPWHLEEGFVGSLHKKIKEALPYFHDRMLSRVPGMQA